MSETQGSWPPSLLAVMHNGDGEPEYYRPWAVGESLADFIHNIARLAVREINHYPYTTFRHIISGQTGEPYPTMTSLVEEAMAEERLKREADNQRLDTLANN